MQYSVSETLHRLGFEALTPMQKALADAAGHGQGGVVLLSPTGSGKTLAYLLPLLSLLNEHSDALQAVVTVPTRELAKQSEEVLRSLRLPIRAMALYGGRPTMDEHRSLKGLKPQVVFATPGRLEDHLSKGNLRAEGVAAWVIDEFDKCLELGFQEVMDQLAGRFGRVPRVWLLSATAGEGIPAFMARLTGKRCRTLDFLDGSAETAAQRTAFYEVKSPEKDKLTTLGRLLTELGSCPTIVLVAHRESAERVANYLREGRFAAEVYHGGMEQQRRERALFLFRQGSATVLVSTDLAARGLDIPEVGAIVHYHLPLTAEDFTHRNGRTARWEATGQAFLITSPVETLPEFAAQVEPLPHPLPEHIAPTPAPFTTLYIGRGKAEKLSKADILGFLCKKGGLNASQIGRIDVAPHCAFAAVRSSLVKQLLTRIAGEKIKGMKTIVKPVKN